MAQTSLITNVVEFIPIWQIYLCLLTLLIVAVFLTHKCKNRFLLWAAILLPPLLIIPLRWIPRDIMTTIFWAPAAIAYIWSIVVILYRCLKIIIKCVAVACKASPKNALHGLPFIKLIRPAMVIGIYMYTTHIVNLSVMSADRYGVTVAKQIQAQAQADGLCPDIIKGWPIDDRDWIDCEKLYGEYGTKYPLRYKVSDDKLTFKLYVRHSIDVDFVLLGGVETELKAEKWSHSKVKEVPLPPD